MVTYITRAQWGARAPRGSRPLLASRVVGVVDHWPGMAKPINAVGDAGFRRVCSALRGWQTYHMDSRGWSDIAYLVAVDQEGRAYTLRGLNIQSGANGNQDVNERFGAVLLILAPGEKPTAKMKATTKAVHADFKKRFPKCRTRPYGHGEVRPDGTDCPGPAARAAIKAGEFDAATPQPSTTTYEDTMALSPEAITQIRAAVQAEEEEYAIRFWVNSTGTGTALINLCKAMKLQLDRIEDDTDGAAATQALLEEIDRNVEELKARPVQTAQGLPKA